MLIFETVILRHADGDHRSDRALVQCDGCGERARLPAGSKLHKSGGVTFVLPRGWHKTWDGKLGKEFCPRCETGANGERR